MQAKHTGLVIQPFDMEILPIQKLILFNFEKAPDEIYKGLEFQYIASAEQLAGYRVIAYRNDDYVDLYEEKHLVGNSGGCEVCGKGLKHHRQVSFDAPNFELTQAGVRVGFAFKDYKGREILIKLEEHARKKSRPLDLVAPVGVSSEKPVTFPAFPMYTFDFVRKRHTDILIKIGGKKMVPDPFVVPMPKDGQMRYFMRYAYDCELVEFGRSKEQLIKPGECYHNQLRQKGLVADFVTQDGNYGMRTLKFEHSRHRFEMQFQEAFPDLLRMKDGCIEGKFYIHMDASMGYFSGIYTVSKANEEVTIGLEVSDGWTVENKMFFTKMMLKKDSVFRQWPATYRYVQAINLKTYESTSQWSRIEKGVKWEW
ncbi:MAG: hypothetical protein ACRCW2_15735 [Cellulosilyticaceae bacterium]